PRPRVILPPMVDLLLTLLRILFPLDPVARLREITRDYISQIMGWLDDPLDVEEIAHREDLREILEAHIIAAEHGVQLLITERARQIAGLPFIYTARIAPPYLRRTKSLSRLLKRLTNLARLFHNLERLAHRRAERMQLERANTPLRLAPSVQSTSPTLRVVEDSVIMLEVLHRRRRGRWIGASSRRDGGGCALPRGPPTNPNSRNQNPPHLAATCENAYLFPTPAVRGKKPRLTSGITIVTSNDLPRRKRS
ncbi:MAG: hypothetical protein Q8R82_01395, partial [Hyphomonadaceae bacterium]|nr:hypothetical protein [Hyphomonadaceae bacterium]